MDLLSLSDYNLLEINKDIAVAYASALVAEAKEPKNKKVTFLKKMYKKQVDDCARELSKRNLLSYI